MKATWFEYRHQTLLHLTAVLIAFLTYLVDKDDVIWAMVRGFQHPRLSERLFFAFGTLLIGASTALRTWAHTRGGPPGFRQPLPFLNSTFDWHRRYPLEIGNFLFSIGVGLLAPLSGFVFLVLSESILMVRLIAREQSIGDSTFGERLSSIAGIGPSSWANAIRKESGKWGIFLAMIVFTILLVDRVVEVLIASSVVLSLALNYKPQKAAT